MVWIPLKFLHTQYMHISLTKNFSVMDAYDHVAPSSWIFLNLKWYFKVWGIFYKYHGDLNSGPWSCEEGSLPLFYRCFLWDKWFKKEMSKKILDLYFFSNVKAAIRNPSDSYQFSMIVTNPIQLQFCSF
jgi:hypothetical protein